MNQNQAILRFLKSGNSLTALRALELFRCFRLAARINDLKESGEAIERSWVKTAGGARIVQYRLGR